MAFRIFPQRKSGLWDPLGHETDTGGKLFNGIRVALPGALSPYLAPPGLVLGFPQATGACFSATRFTHTALRHLELHFILFFWQHGCEL